MIRVGEWANGALDTFIERYMGLAIMAIVALTLTTVALVLIWPPATCRVALAGGEVVMRKGCHVDAYRPSYVTGVIGKGGFLVPEHAGTGSLVCGDVSYAPGAWVSCDCGGQQ